MAAAGADGRDRPVKHTVMDVSEAAKALRDAAAKGHVEEVEALLRQGADVHAADAGGLQALHYAAREATRRWWKP